MKKPNKVDRRVEWMQRFENHVIEAAPEHTGKIEWNDAVYFYNVGINALEAARRYVERREVRP